MVMPSQFPLSPDARSDDNSSPTSPARVVVEGQSESLIVLNQCLKSQRRLDRSPLRSGELRRRTHCQIFGGEHRLLPCQFASAYDGEPCWWPPYTARRLLAPSRAS
jgi:hypothetical protein